MNSPIWIEVHQVVAINAEQVSKTGEVHFLRDFGLLEAAVMSPRDHWHYEGPDLVQAFGNLLFAIAKAHAFEQGNKRTAFHAAAEFLARNGATLILPDTDYWAEKIEELITHSSLSNDFVNVMRVYTILP
ncbi:MULTISPECIES: type II toxin-antitoxin system death-on-curing family toxin [Rhizobium]|uniref:type II toxin-antitoxin system death-on-curing family toxin n=1 Tax=Rhizobium TaxID=379 RepID=UPI000BEA66A1|nr:MULTISPECIES: Fic family protein [Rhizobium]MBY4587888.1 Fic family protein [Rhizobium redzepovicii]MBY4615885.1 Fic family protein [Rhizobium redzepovicii]MDF0659274.1 Fic family protein [Rhizobium sp. BC49]PDS83102.1 type II toxin-antitoxin system death-on-curing family toxin [Rhizobium sp. L18]TBY45469.1 type II toxin-antitoxin system death-on-curing family toxin [Rhizobium leguminosarum bv. viciae]